MLTLASFIAWYNTKSHPIMPADCADVRERPAPSEYVEVKDRDCTGDTPALDTVNSSILFRTRRSGFRDCDVRNTIHVGPSTTSMLMSDSRNPSATLRHTMARLERGPGFTVGSRLVKASAAGSAQDAAPRATGGRTDHRPAIALHSMGASGAAGAAARAVCEDRRSSGIVQRL